jgi:hypothetical protein
VRLAPEAHAAVAAAPAFYMDLGPVVEHWVTIAGAARPD